MRIKLPLLDGFCDARRNAAEFYSNALANHPNIVTPVISDFTTHVFHQYTLQIIDADRDALHQHLLDNKIPNAIYYPVPLHSQKAYADERYNEDDFTVTNELIGTVLSLPMHTEFDEEQLTFITKTILEFLK